MTGPFTNPETTRAFLALLHDLSAAGALDGVVDVIRRAVCDLTGADGATFVVRDGDEVSYVDEHAIAPLWKGRRFPANACISGWAIVNRTQVVIDDVFADPRVPADVYRSTFVQSLVMTPVGREPVAAIGAYWGAGKKIPPDAPAMLRLLANVTAMALAHVDSLHPASLTTGARVVGLRAREDAVNAREGVLGQREAVVHARESLAEGRERALGGGDADGSSLDGQRSMVVDERERTAQARENVVVVREDALLTREGALLLREETLRAQEEARAAREEATAVARRSAEFREHLAAVISHDLRNPLMAIMTGIQAMIRRGHLEATDARAAGRIAASADRMSRLISLLLDYSRIRADGTVRIDRERISLHALVERSIDETQAAHPDRTIRLIATHDLVGDFDEDRLAQVLSNVIGNACEHGGPDCVVTVTLQRRGADAELIVHNTGHPVPPDVLPHIFEPFQRGPGSRSSGLGMFITQQLVQAHGGTIAIESSAEAGTTVTIRLPLLS